MTKKHSHPAIDVHTHVAPSHAEHLATIMETNNLSAVVNLGILEWLGIPFEEGMRAFHKALGNRMAYFPLAHFHDTSPGFGERMAEELERKVAAGASGLKVLKELGLRYKDSEGNLIPVDDPRLDVLWDRAGQLGVPVLIHTADPVAFFQPLDENNERKMELELSPDWHFFGPEFPDHDTLLDQRNRVIERHPHTIFIGAHLGNYPENLTYVDACLERYANFYVDTSARIAEIGRHPVKEARAFFLKHQDRVLFGTDLVLGWVDDPTDENQQAETVDLSAIADFYGSHWPFFETDQRQLEYPFYPVQGGWTVNAIGLPGDVLEKLYVGNARRLIPRLRE
jgi:predicted TIM-barrel fold metal-dependent hydrolase